jgi:hypothetical protein
VFVELREWEEVVGREEGWKAGREGCLSWQRGGVGFVVEGDRKEFNTWVSLAVRDIGGNTPLGKPQNMIQILSRAFVPQHTQASVLRPSATLSVKKEICGLSDTPDPIHLQSRSGADRKLN